MRVDVHFDVICPWCCVGFQRYQHALQQRPNYQFETYLHPYFLNQDPEDYALDFISYMEKKVGGSLRVERLLYTFREIGEAIDIQFNFEDIRSVPNTLNAHKLIRLAQTNQQQVGMAQSIFRAYFTHGLDIGDTGVLQEIADEFGFGDQEIQALFRDEALTEQIITDVQFMKRSGANGIPFFVFENAFQITGAHEPEVLIRMMEVANTFANTPNEFSALRATLMTSPHHMPVR